MNRPEMILFDYGTTLMYEPDFDPHAGNRAIYPYITHNPMNISFEEFDCFLISSFNEIRKLRGELIELHEHLFLRYVLDYLRLELSVSIPEAEQIIVGAVTHARRSPGADLMLSQLRSLGIRTGVISNLCWSGAVLERRLTESFPEHSFEFIMTSSEHVFRKPHPRIFELALNKAGLTADRVWFCGNDTAVDVIGAHGVGLFPVLFDHPDVNSDFRAKNNECVTNFPYLHITDWTELISALADTE